MIARLLQVQPMRGFTLIEMLVVVVMLTVLLSIALPLYQDSVVRSNRAAARGILMDVVMRQEQFFINNKIYAEELADLGYDVDGEDAFYVDNQMERFDAADDALYKVELASVSARVFFVSAEPLNLQLKDGLCEKYCLSSEGERRKISPTDGVDKCDTIGTPSPLQCW